MDTVTHIKESPRSDQTLLVLLAQNGDRAALEQLLHASYAPLRRYIIRLAGVTLADDVLQETSIQIFRKLPSLREPAVFRPWSFRIASRIAFSHLKRARHWQPLDDVPPEQLIALDPSLGELPNEVFLNLLDHVSPASRAVLLLHYQHGLSLEESAVILDIRSHDVSSSGHEQKHAHDPSSSRQHPFALTSSQTRGRAGEARLLYPDTRIGQQIAIATALGASRREILRMAMRETAVIAAMGGVLGIVLAAVLVPLMQYHLPPELNFRGALHLDWAGAVYALLLTGMRHCWLAHFQHGPVPGRSRKRSIELTDIRTVQCVSLSVRVTLSSRDSSSGNGACGEFHTCA